MTVERRALELGVTAIATIGVVSLGFYLLNVRSDLAVIAGAVTCLGGAVVGGARMARLLGVIPDTKRIK